MIRNYNLLRGSRDTRLKKRGVTDVGKVPSLVASTKGKSSAFVGWLAAIMLLIGFKANAQQISSYAFAESTETYAQITGTNSTASGDDGTQNAIPIGFTFSYGGIDYTTFSVTTNGMIRLGSNIVTGVPNYGNTFSATADNRPLIAPFWDDNNLNTGTIRYSSSGGVLTVNWHNINIGGSGATGGGNASFLLRLYQTTNVIEFVYGSPFTSTNALSASVGLNGTSTFLSVTPGATSTVSGATANNAINAAAAANLAGKKYTFTPPVISTPPTCASAFVPAAGATNVSNLATLSWAAATNDPASYDVYFGTSPTPPLVTNTAGLTYTPAALLTSTTYYWQIVPKNSAGSAVGCSVQSFTTSSSYTYCAPTYSSGGCLGDEITAVVLGSLSDTGLTCTPNYEDRSGAQGSIPVISQSTIATVSVSFGTHATQHSGVWIDYNHNGVFESSEFTIGASVGASGTANIAVSVPGTALTGLTKMRVRGGDDSALSAGQACGATNSSFGTTRDYNVNIGPPPACIAPSGLSATAVSTTGATLNWNCTGCTGTFRLEYHTSPATFGGVGNVVVDPATTGTVIAGLSPNTEYTFFVRQDCGGAGFSTVTSLTFKTGTPGENCVDALPLAVAVDAASAPNTNVVIGLTADGPAGYCSNATGNPNKQDRWISFVAPSNGNKIVIITSAATSGPTVTDTVMQVWAGCPATGTAMGCNDDINTAGGNLYSRLEFCQNQYVGGQTYYVQVWPWSLNTAGNAFNIKIYEEPSCPLPPANDECSGVEAISIGFAGSCPDNATFGTTVNATASGGIAATTCDPFATYLDVMYTFNSGSNTDMSFTFDNITGSNEFAFYGGCGTTPLAICGAGDYNTIITGMTLNTDYYLIVYANNAAAMGTFSICMSSLAPPGCVTAPIAPTNGATNVNTCAATILSWNAVPNAVQYDVYFNAGTTATVLVSDNQTAFLGTNTYNVGTLTGSTTYAWRIVGINSAGEATGCTDFTFTTGAATATPGDTFAGAIDLGLVTASATANGDTACYTNDFTTTSTPGSVNAAGSKDIFYKFEIGCTSDVTIGLCTASFDTYLHLLDSTGAPIEFSDDNCGFTTQSLLEDIELEAGVYYVVVEGYLTNSGTFTLDITRGGPSCSSTVNLKMFVEGYYIGNGVMTSVEDNQAGVSVNPDNVEMITVELRDVVAPYDVVDTTTAMLHTDGTATCEFSTSPVGSYYIVVKTRNTIETWSGTPQTVGTTPLIYNFSNAASKAYGDNMIEVEAGIFALFSGDISVSSTQDGFVDLVDYSSWEFDNNTFAIGSFASDLNGDGFVDLADYSIWESNNNAFVGSIIPF